MKKKDVIIKEYNSNEKIELMKTILNSTNQDYLKYLNQGWNITRSLYGSKIGFFAPNILEYNIESFKGEKNKIFQSISITGRKCSLMCDHCKGKLLESMHQVNNPNELIEIGKRLKTEGCKGVLLSGGSSKDGTLPFNKYIDAIKYLNKYLNFKIAVHTGLINLDTALDLKNSGVESAMIDIIGSEKTIKQIYHLNKKPEDFEDSLSALVESKMPVSPHIVVGLHYGEVLGELNAISIISKYPVKNIVIVAYKPLEIDNKKIKVASPLEIGKIISISRIINPDKKILLGCARPGGMHKIKTDILAIRAGVNGIAFPTKEAITYADKINLHKEFSPYCCSFIDL